MSARSTVPPPDLTTSLPNGPVRAGHRAVEEAAAVLAGDPADLFRRLLTDQESETALLTARQVLRGFLAGDEAPDTDPPPSAAFDIAADTDVDADAVAAYVLAARGRVAPALAALTGADADPEVRDAVLRQRAPLALLGACWLDTVSQAATQPALVVNDLFGHHFLLAGEGTWDEGAVARRRRALAGQGVHLPDVAAAAFLTDASARPLTALHGAFRLALSRLPASFLPEVVGFHYAIHALGVDDLLLGTEPMLPEEAVRDLLASYLRLVAQSPTGADDLRRLLAAVRLAVRLEEEHTASLTELAAWQSGLSLDARVAAIVAKHAAFAGRQHRAVRLGDRRLSEWLDDEGLDLAAFMAEFRASRQVRPSRDGGCRFLKAIKFGGPMFGIFDEREAATFTAWTEAIASGEPADLDFPPNTAGDAAAGHWARALVRARAADEVVGQEELLAECAALGHRELLHRLVNFERFPGVLPAARAHAEARLADAELLFTHGSDGRQTDATYFPYTPDALMRRVEGIYWDKLVDPYEPLSAIPDRDEVVFGQSTSALASLIDGTWAHRIGNVGRRHRPGDGMLFAIYADEMGRGDIAKNHITLIHRVLASMDIHLPHIRDEAFLDQDDLPDDVYGFALHQASLALFPDSLYEEILGYNLGVEMFGLGALRMHEIQKLRSHGFDTSYEEAHLSIDNFSAGHARQSADIIVAHLDSLGRDGGDEAVQRAWRRVWRGYASFAYFVEQPLVKRALRAEAAREAEAARDGGAAATGEAAHRPGPEAPARGDDDVAELLL
ncbi:iron-containing redox enzyme family protein [Streptomyces sp. DH12]|uniref:iron-containing redox enzyme family protein n=1 Tax=Streptomyces sp. DH12 TaxID=2857010 RepID=UPI001E623F58|nr:iron-containing redox enzyme family protein [Streptomyces sp. DH12]